MAMIAIQLYGWEINTHRAIDRRAILSSGNLNTFLTKIGMNLNSTYEDDSIFYDGYGMTYIQYITEGEGNGISDWNQTFSDDKGTTAKIKEPIEAGAILEDAQWPHALTAACGRFVNHFYDPQDTQNPKRT